MTYDPYNSVQARAREVHKIYTPYKGRYVSYVTRGGPGRDRCHIERTSMTSPQAKESLVIVPDSTGTMVIRFEPVFDSENQICEITETTFPVIAWGITAITKYDNDGFLCEARGEYPEPIVCEQSTKGIDVLQLSNGVLIIPEDRQFDSVEDARAEAERRIRAANEKTAGAPNARVTDGTR